MSTVTLFGAVNIAELLGYAIGVGGNFCETSCSQVLATIFRFVSLHGWVHNVLSIPTHQWRHSGIYYHILSVYINGILGRVTNLRGFI